MRSLLNNDTAYLRDRKQGQVYEHDCTYGGKKLNLYNNGTIFEFNELLQELYPSLYNSSIKARDAETIRRSFKQDELPYP